MRTKKTKLSVTEKTRKETTTVAVETMVDERNHGEKDFLSNPPEVELTQGDYKDKFSNPPPSLCFICNSPHWTQKCPKKSKINALLTLEEEEEPKQKKREV